MTNGIISKEDTQRLVLILAAIKMLNQQIRALQYQIDTTIPNYTLNQIRREIIKEKSDTVQSLQNDYDVILESYGIRRTRKRAA